MTQRDVEALLEDLPVSTPQEVNKAKTALDMFLKMRDAAFEGTGARMIPVVGLAFTVPELIRKLQEGDVAGVAESLVSVGGDAATTFSVLATAATEAGAITSATAGMAQAGVVAGFIGDAAGPAGIGLATLIATFQIPSSVNANQWKIFYIADVSGTLTSWLFPREVASPHARLVQMARRGGYMRTDVSDACRVAHRRAHRYWVSTFQPSRAHRLAARAAARGSWERYWRELAGALESNLDPFPTGIGAAFAEQLIHETRTRAREAAREARARQRRAAARAAAGGVWVTTEDGLELFLPDD